jgi:hypothetical protein
MLIIRWIVDGGRTIPYGRCVTDGIGQGGSKIGRRGVGGVRYDCL